MTETTNPPVSEPEAQPMMTFTELEVLVDKQNQDQDKGETQSIAGTEPPEGQGQVDDPIAKALADDGSGFKTLDDLVKSRKEAHATITKLAQEKAAMQRDLEALSQFPQMIMQQMQQQPVTQPAPQGQATDSLTEELFKDMAPFVDRLVEQRASQIVDNKLAMRDLGGRVNTKRSENPEEFDELRPIMLNILQSNPHYEAHPNGLNVVYDMAKQARDNRIAKITEKIFGAPVDKVRQALELVMSGNANQVQPQGGTVQQQASPSSYVPPASASTPPMVQTKPNYDAEIANRKNRPDRTMVDDVTDLWWNKVTSQSQNSDNRPRR